MNNAVMEKLRANVGDFKLNLNNPKKIVTFDSSVKCFRRYDIKYFGLEEGIFTPIRNSSNSRKKFIFVHPECPKDDIVFVAQTEEYTLIDAVRDSLLVISGSSSERVHHNYFGAENFDPVITPWFKVKFNKNGDFNPYVYIEFPTDVEICIDKKNTIKTKVFAICCEKYHKIYPCEDNGILRPTSLFEQDIASPFVAFDFFDCISVILSNIVYLAGFHYKYDKKFEGAVAAMYNDDDIPLEL